MTTAPEADFVPMTANDARRVLLAAEGVLSIPSFAKSKRAANWHRQRDMARTIIALRARLGDADDAP